MTKIRIGQEIKQEVQKQDLTIEDFAKNLHLASSEIENIFNKTSLETDLLLKISKLLKRDFFSLFSNYVIEDAYKEIISLLKQKGDKRYIAVPDWEDECRGYDGDGTKVSIFGIGLDDDDEICIAAVVDNIGYGHGPDDFPQEWTKATELYEPNYCAFYRFVANNIEKAMTKDEADELADKYWNGNGCDYGKYDWQDCFIWNGLIKVRLDGKYGFINKDGEEIIPCKYEDADNIPDGLIRVKSAEGWGFVNENGEEIISCKYEYAGAFSDGLARVKSAEDWGFVNENGEEIISCKYEDAGAFSDGLARVKSAEGWGFVNKNGEEIISCKYEDADDFFDGLARVQSKEGWGFVNKEGEEIIPCKYEDAYAFEGGLSLVKSKEGYGFINNDGEEIIPCKYEDAHGFLFGADTAEVKLNGEWINIDKTGKKTGKQVTELL